MAGELTVTAANGLFKRVYADGVKDLRPKSAIIQRMKPLTQRKKVGESYQISMALTNPQGFTYLGSSGAVSALNAAANMLIKQASVTPSARVLREQVAYEVLSRAVEGNNAQAFEAATAAIVSAMKVAHANRVEAEILHGQRGYGTVDTVTDNGSSNATIKFTAATFSPGLFWHMGQGSYWDSFTGTTKNNTGTLILETVDAANRQITVTYSGTLANDVAAGDVFWPRGANAGSSSFNEMQGLLDVASRTTSNTYGLSTVTYSNLAGNTVNVGGPLSHGVLEDSLAYLRDRGAADELTVFISSRGYGQLVTELAQLRRFSDAQGAALKSGAKSVSYTTPEIGDVTIVNHPMMKWGEALILPMDEVERIGSSDITFGVPGMEEQFFQLVSGYNAVELQNYSDQAAVIHKPCHSMVITGITF